MALSGIESTSSVLTTILEFRSRMKKSSPLLSARHLFLLLSFALLAACETVPDVKNDHDLLPRTARKCSETAELSGRVSMNYTLSHNDRAESMHGRFTWKQNRHATKIALFSPLGQTM
ncbi:hypothetical protein LJC19_08025, partial [Oxalobacter sp. OttesenSCG-928-P03]|nr:hypothetical protein [Oxalobacter sp. OttesenSCG-928-P03]